MFLQMHKFLSLVLLALLLAACGGDELADQSAGQRPNAPPGPTLCPLTGVETTIDISRPAVAVKIDNAPPARPQAGIEAADIVWEEIGEGGLTRLMSIFHCSDAATLGSVRSARTVDPDILVEYKPVLFGYSGANDQVLQEVASTQGIIDLKHGTSPDAYTRESSRRAPYNLFTSTDKLRALPPAKDVTGPPKTGFVFNADVLNAAPASPTGDTAVAAPAPAPGNSVTFSYSPASNVRYTYDGATKRYLRFHGDTPHKTNSGEQVSAVNVVVMKVNVVPGTVRDASGTLTQDTTVIGSGDATIVRGGTAVTGKWNRSSVGDNTTLTDASGNTVELAPGNTWVHLLPQERPLTVQ
jgi:hypothetical protein